MELKDLYRYQERKIVNYYCYPCYSLLKDKKKDI